MLYDVIRAVAYVCCVLVCPHLVRKHLVEWFHVLQAGEFCQGALVFLLVALVLDVGPFVRALARARQTTDSRARPYVEDLVEQFADPVTLDVLVRPVTLDCGHSIGERGLAELKRICAVTSRPLACPMCKLPIKAEIKSTVLRNAVAPVMQLKELYGLEGGRSF